MATVPAGAHEGVDAKTRAALALSREEIVAQSPVPLVQFDDNDALIGAFARAIGSAYDQALSEDRARVAMIVPVGPVGQYHRLADACIAADKPLDRLTLILMDEYLTHDCHWIPESDPLSFRRHVRESLLDRLPANLRPTVVVPDPQDLGNVGRTIAAHGGLDVCFAGVGITGHLAFNDPVPMHADPDWFAALGTRIVSLSPETRLINAVTAARGNTLRIPHLAVTVGMKEILGARRLRIVMNREWQCAAIRRMLFGPVTGAFPASLVQRHRDVAVHAARHVLNPPEPALR